MRNLWKARQVVLSVAVGSALALAAKPAWALVQVPAPAVGGLAAAGIVGALIAAKLWRRK